MEKLFSSLTGSIFAKGEEEQEKKKVQQGNNK
jgi:hypothetical protein